MANAHHSRRKYAQIAKKLRGQKRSLETRRRISKSLMGHTFSAETIKKFRQRKWSKKMRDYFSKKAMGRRAWNKGLKLGNLHPNSGQFQKGQRMSEEMRLKIKKAWIKKLRKINPHHSPTSHSTARNQRIIANGGFHSKEEWERLKLKYRNRCAFCKRKEAMTKDHIVPLLRGGTNDIKNIQPLCRSCNSTKSYKLLVENRTNSGNTQNGQS